MKTAIGNDHAGYDLKVDLVEHLDGARHHVVDDGHHCSSRADYPAYGRLVAEAVARGDVARGIVIWGSGVGISIAPNTVRGIRAVCCSEPYSVLISRRHNETNVLSLGARVVGSGLARLIVDQLLSGTFEGGRPTHRVGQIHDFEEARASSKRPGGEETWT